MSAQKTIIIVEDEPDAAEMFAEMMQVVGFRVLKSHNGQSAISIIEREVPDVVILDIMMPDFSGLDVLKHLRRNPALAHTPVVIVSAKGTPADIQNGMNAGASIYLTKPVGFLELQNAVENSLNNRLMPVP